MRGLSIALMMLVFSWLPTTASALLLEYDLEFGATLYNSELRTEINKTYYGTALTFFDGVTTNIDDTTFFKQTVLGFSLEVDGTTLSGDGKIRYFNLDTLIDMNFADGGISVGTNDFIYVEPVYAGSVFQYIELTLPMDIAFISGNYYSSGGDLTIVANADIDPTWDRADVSLEGAGFRFYNGREVEVTVPEPAIIWLFGSGLVLIGFMRRKA